MACARYIWILFVSVIFGVFNEGVPIDEAPITTDVDISNSGIDPSASSPLYENIKFSRGSLNTGILDENDIEEFEGILAPTQLHGDRRNEYSNRAVNMEKSNDLPPKVWLSSGLKSEKPSKSANENEGEAEDESNPTLRDTSDKPRTFKEANVIEMTDYTDSYADIVHIGPANYDMEPANVNVLNVRRERATETTESDKEDVFDIDRSSLIDNMNTIGLDVNNVPSIGRQIFVNKVIFRVQLQMEYDTDNIPPDIKTDGTLENINVKRSPTKEVESETQEKASVSVSPENIKKIMLERVNGDIDRKPFQEKQTTQLNGYSRNQKSKYNSNSQETDTDIGGFHYLVEYSTDYAISSKNIHAEEINSDVDATTNTESPTLVDTSSEIKISLRSNFADDYLSASNATDVSAATINEVRTNKSKVTETDTPRQTNFPSSARSDKTVEDTPEVAGAEAVMEKRLERFMFMEMGLGVIIIVSSVTTAIQIMVMVKKLKGIRNKYECTAVP